MIAYRVRELGQLPPEEKAKVEKEGWATRERILREQKRINKGSQWRRVGLKDADEKMVITDGGLMEAFSAAADSLEKACITDEVLQHAYDTY